MFIFWYFLKIWSKLYLYSSHSRLEFGAQRSRSLKGHKRCFWAIIWGRIGIKMSNWCHFVMTTCYKQLTLGLSRSKYLFYDVTPEWLTTQRSNWWHLVPATRWLTSSWSMSLKGQHIQMFAWCLWVHHGPEPAGSEVHVKELSARLVKKLKYQENICLFPNLWAFPFIPSISFFDVSSRWVAFL